MTKNEVLILTKKLLKKWKLYDWKVSFNRRKKSYGLCYQLDKEIVFSVPFISVAPDEQVRDIILHEIAHALTDPKEPHHGEVWRANALKVGARPEQYTVAVITPRYTASCEACGQNFAAHRRLRKMENRYCSKCMEGPLKWKLTA